MKLLWIITLILVSIVGFMCYVNYHNSKDKTYLTGMVLCIIAMILEALALIAE